MESCGKFGLMVVAWVYEACFVGGDDGLGAVTAAEFEQDVADVGLDGGFAEEEPSGDLAVGQAPGDVDEDLGLSGGEVGQGGPRAVRRAPREFAYRTARLRGHELRITIPIGVAVVAGGLATALSDTAAATGDHEIGRAHV